jgi:hypothetical protein
LVEYTFTVTALGGGNDRLAFNFNSPSSDESWALDQVSLVGVGAAVPEPGVSAILLAGVGGLGGILRRRRSISAAAA